MNCEKCDKLFEPTRTWQRFCSFTCQRKSVFAKYYLKNKVKIIRKAREYEKLVFGSWSKRNKHRGKVRQTILKRDEYKCTKCHSTNNLDVNHKRYGKDLDLSDFETLCRSCHKIFGIAPPKTPIRL